MNLPDPEDPSTFLSYDWIRLVANTPENDMRSAQIALTYSKFASAIDDCLFKDRSISNSQKRTYKVADGACELNWFHFATWAVLTAGRNIGNTRAPQRLNLLPNRWRNQLSPAVIHARAEDNQRIGRTLAWAQRSIFMTVSFALLAALEQEGVEVAGRRLGETREQRENREKTGERFNPVDEKTTKTAFLSLGWGKDADCKETEDAWGYYKLSRDAFAVFGLIKSTLRMDPKFDVDVISRLMLYVNVMTTAIEQKLIDDGVRAIVDTAPEHAFDVLEGRLAQIGDRFFRVPKQLTLFVAPGRLKPARDVANKAWGRLLTDQLFVMALPGETLRVGRDIPPRDPRRPFYPRALRNLRNDDAIENEGGKIDDALEDLRRLMFRFDRTTFDGRGSGAQDWRSFESRMNWAITLLRSRQRDASLSWSPFSRADARRIIASELPERSGDPMELEVLPPLDRGASA